MAFCALKEKRYQGLWLTLCNKWLELYLTWLIVANILGSIMHTGSHALFSFFANSYLNYMPFLIQQGLQAHPKKKLQADMPEILRYKILVNCNLTFIYTAGITIFFEKLCGQTN